MKYELDSEAQEIARGVLAGDIEDPTNGAIYFGNDTSAVCTSCAMETCKQIDYTFWYERVGDTTMYIANKWYHGCVAPTATP